MHALSEKKEYPNQKNELCLPEVSIRDQCFYMT